MVSVERWKRKLRVIGFDGSVNGHLELDGSVGDNLVIEAVSEDRGLKCVQRVFKVGGNDSRTARELLREFSAALRQVYDECQEQVLNCQPR